MREAGGLEVQRDGLEEAEATIQKGKQREIIFLARETKLTELAVHEWTSRDVRGRVKTGGCDGKTASSEEG